MQLNNHMVMRDHEYERQMSGQYWTEETETCPMCNGDRWIANRCECGIFPDIDEDNCVGCGKPIHWKNCPVCLGMGEIKKR